MQIEYGRMNEKSRMNKKENVKWRMSYEEGGECEINTEEWQRM